MAGGTFHELEGDGEVEKDVKVRNDKYISRDDYFKEQKLEAFEQEINEMFRPEILFYDP